MAGFNSLDIIIIVIFFLSAIIGFIRGFIAEFISLVILIAAVAIAIYFAVPLANYFTNTETVQSMMNQTSSATGTSTTQSISYFALGISFTVLFLGTLLVGLLVKALLNLAALSGVFGFGNMLLGALFGLVRGFIFNLILIFLLQLSPVSASPFYLDSQLVKTFQPALLWLDNWVSPNFSAFKDKVGKTIQNMGTKVQAVTSSL